MKSVTILPHAAWAIAAAAAFAIGHQSGRGGRAPQASPAPVAATGEAASTPWSRAKEDVAAQPQAAASGPSAQVVADAPVVLSAEAMTATLAKILQESDPIKRNRLFAELLEKLTPENVQSAIETLQQGGLDPGNFRDMALLTYAWGKMDPTKAMAYADALDHRGKAFVTASILSGWASKSPAAAMAWFRESKLDGFEKNIAARGLIEGMVQTDLATATRLATEESDPAVKGQFFEALAKQQLKTSGPAATREWIDGLLAAGTLPADALGGAVRDVSRQLALSDPKDAVTWAMSLPEGDAQRGALNPAIREWGRKDPTAASGYLTQLPASSGKDRAVQEFSEVIAKEDPKAAVTWAATIAEEGRRERATVRAAQTWYQIDAAAATQWAETSGLSEEARKKISAPPEQGGGGRWRH